jgi:hypothetical protein
VNYVAIVSNACMAEAKGMFVGATTMTQTAGAMDRVKTTNRRRFR